MKVGYEIKYLVECPRRQINLKSMKQQVSNLTLVNYEGGRSFTRSARIGGIIFLYGECLFEEKHRTQFQTNSNEHLQSSKLQQIVAFQ